MLSHFYWYWLVCFRFPLHQCGTASDYSQFNDDISVVGLQMFSLTTAWSEYSLVYSGEKRGYWVSIFSCAELRKWEEWKIEQNHLLFVLAVTSCSLSAITVVWMQLAIIYLWTAILKMWKCLLWNCLSLSLTMRLCYSFEVSLVMSHQQCCSWLWLFSGFRVLTRHFLLEMWFKSG